MDYFKSYVNLCVSRKPMETERLKLKKDGEYFELHHIKPLCMDGSDRDTNLVLLTAREHFIAHVLLAKWAVSIDHIKKRSLLCAITKMKGNYVQGYGYFNSTLYQILRVEASIAMSGPNNPMYGKPGAWKGVTGSDHPRYGCKISEKNRERLREICGENHPMYGRTHSEETLHLMSIIKMGKIPSAETRQKMADSQTGREHTEETKQKISVALTGKERSPEHCASLSIANMGKTLSEETKQKLSDAMTGREFTDEWKNNISEALKGTVPVKNEHGEFLRVSVDDPRYISGELVPIATGTLCVKDKDGNMFRVDVTDERYLSGELLAVNVGLTLSDSAKKAISDANSKYTYNLILPDGTEYKNISMMEISKMFDGTAPDLRIQDDHKKCKTIGTGQSKFFKNAGKYLGCTIIKNLRFNL